MYEALDEQRRVLNSRIQIIRGNDLVDILWRRQERLSVGLSHSPCLSLSLTHSHSHSHSHSLSRSLRISRIGDLEALVRIGVNSSCDCESVVSRNDSDSGEFKRWSTVRGFPEHQRVSKARHRLNRSQNSTEVKVIAKGIELGGPARVTSRAAFELRFVSFLTQYLGRDTSPSLDAMASPRGIARCERERERERERLY